MSCTFIKNLFDLRKIILKFFLKYIIIKKERGDDVEN